MVGKKQRNIREDNKSVVIDCLLRAHMTLADLEEKLKLSHTALRKVMNELMELNIVRVIEMKTGEMGRPSAVYDINPDCGFAAAVCVGENRLEIFVVDMKGFQTDKFFSETDLGSAEEIFSFTEKKISGMLRHERTKDGVLSTICVSLPFGGILDRSFSECRTLVSEKLKNLLPSAEIVVKNNNDYWAIGESKYGKLHHRQESALLCEVERSVCCSFYYGGINYCGSAPSAGSLNRLFDGDLAEEAAVRIGMNERDFCEAYRRGDDAAVQAFYGLAGPVFTEVGKIARCMCAPTVLLSGFFCSLGEAFLEKANEWIGAVYPCAKAEFSAFTDRSPSCAGAVWCASYTSLKKLL